MTGDVCQSLGGWREASRYVWLSRGSHVLEYQVTPQTTHSGQQAQTTHYESALGGSSVSIGKSALGGSSGHNEFISQVPTVGWV